MTATHPYAGLAVAVTIMVCWAVLVLSVLWTPILEHPLRAIVSLGLLTWLWTGLFITAHDAMHGTVCPTNPRLNHAIGAICVWLFACFHYQSLLQSHGRHHTAPASEADPDFHRGNPRWAPWFISFMVRYITVGQLVSITAVFWAWIAIGGVPIENVVLFWSLPAILSAIQLFHFGTWRPHRTPPEGHIDRHNANTDDFPPGLSLLTCYHFGYHHEHHARPGVPWWRLQEARAAVLTRRPS